MKRISYILVGFIFFLPLFALAQSSSGSSVVGFGNPLQVSSICEALKLFLNVLLTLAMPIAVLFLVYAGFKFVVARGNPKQLQIAKRNFFWVVVGISIFMGCWVLGQILANSLSSLASQAGQSPQSLGSCSSGGALSPAQMLQGGMAPL